MAKDTNKLTNEYQRRKMEVQRLIEAATDTKMKDGQTDIKALKKAVDAVLEPALPSV